MTNYNKDIDRNIIIEILYITYKLHFNKILGCALKAQVRMYTLSYVNWRRLRNYGFVLVSPFLESADLEGLFCFCAME